MVRSSGRSIGISPARQRMIEYMRLSLSVPAITLERTMHLADVKSARESTTPRIGWSACFIKAYALAGQVIPQVRWSYLTVPFGRFFEHETSSATVAVERLVDGEPVVFGFRINIPERRPLAEIDRWLNAAANDPVESVESFRRQMRSSRWPGFIRRWLMWYALRAKGTLRDKHFGTFAVTSIHGSGSELYTPRAPLTTIMTYGQVQADGTVTIRLGFDHRVMDGMTAGRALAEMETALRTTIRDELANGSPSRPS